jgi:hypothetical protein
LPPRRRDPAFPQNGALQSTRHPSQSGRAAGQCKALLNFCSVKFPSNLPCPQILAILLDSRLRCALLCFTGRGACAAQIDEFA